MRKTEGSGDRSRIGGRWWRALPVLAAAAALAVPLIAAPAHAATTPAAAATDTTVTASDWTSAGGNAGDTHDSAAETAISAGNVAGLKEKWAYTTSGDVAATPTVVDGSVYVPDLGGTLQAVAAGTGARLWAHPVSSYTGVAGDVSRTSPAYWRGEIVVGDGSIVANTASGAFVFAADATTGAKLWSTRVDTDPNAFITGSPVVANGTVYVGISSRDEGLPPGQQNFRGSLVALDAKTGKLLWKTFTVPQGYTGGAIWGSNPVVDAKTGLVYVGTGNNYTTPAGVCQLPSETGCTEPAADDFQDAIVAFNATTGAIAWGTRTLTADTWTLAEPFGPDFDFGNAPDLFTATIGGKATDLIGIGQKSGVYWALDATTGKIVWDTAVGPGGETGGMEWGSAVDGNRIYVANTNSGGISTTLTSATGQKSTTTAGFWAALDTATGKILWETAVPPGAISPYSFVSAANGVMYSGTLFPTGNNMFALDGATGTIKWAFPSGGSVVAGAAIVNGTVYWGSGYPTLQVFQPFDGSNDKLYAFALPSAAPSAQVFVSPSGKAGAADSSCATAAFSSINAAITAVADNGTVSVCPGTYHQEVAVTKPVSLGATGDVTIDATGFLHGIDVLAPDVTVASFTVENAIGEGILVDGAASATVESNAVSGDDLGAGGSEYAQCSTGRADCGGGIHLLGASGATVAGNTVSGDASGIVISDETGPAAHDTVSGNNVTGNAVAGGIILAGGNSAAAPGGTPAPAAGGVFSDTITANTVAANGLSAPSGSATAGGGIVLESALAGAGVYGNTVSGDIVSGNGGPGLAVHALAAGQDFNGNQLTGNQVGTNGTLGDSVAGDTQTTGIAVKATGPLTITVTGNIIGTNDVGIWLAGPVTAGSVATSNTFSGVTTPVSTH